MHVPVVCARAPESAALQVAGSQRKQADPFLAVLGAQQDTGSVGELVGDDVSACPGQVWSGAGDLWHVGAVGGGLFEDVARS